jgi:hypothetical protein
MRIPLLVAGRVNHASSADRLLRLRKVLKSAQRTAFYRLSLARAGLHSARSLRELRDVEEAVGRLAICEQGPLPPRPRPGCVSASALHNPIPGKPPIVFASQAHGKSPEILAGRFASLVSLAGSVRVERALIVLTGVREGVLEAPDRDRLWSAFGVPVFEQHLGLDGQVVAHECEAHDGLHIVQNNAVLELAPHRTAANLLLTSLTDVEQPTLRLRTGFSGEIRLGECECGSSEPRLMHLARCR